MKMRKVVFLFCFVLMTVFAFAQSGLTVSDTSGISCKGEFACDFPVMPTFPGGDASFDKFIKDNLHYPDSAKTHGIEGTVYIQFTIDSSGKLSDFVERKGVPGYPGFTAEAIRVLKLSPDWEMKGVVEKKFTYVKPFRFKLSSNENKTIAVPASQKCGIQIPEAELHIVTFTEVMPLFPGDSMLTYIMHQLKYPAHIDHQLCGAILYVQFVIDTAGRVINVEMKKPLPSECQQWTEQVLNVFCKMPNWKPGESNGRPVNVRMIVPLRLETGR
jgi:TonB family protein